MQEKVHHQGAAENEVRVIVVKRDGTRCPTTAPRHARLQRACWKRPVDDATLEQVVDRVEDTIFRNNEREVSSQYIGLVIATCPPLDRSPTCASPACIGTLRTSAN